MKGKINVSRQLPNFLRRHRSIDTTASDDIAKKNPSAWGNKRVHSANSECDPEVRLDPSDHEWLCQLVRSGNVSETRVFLEKTPALVATTGKDGNSAIHVAVLSKQPEIVKVLVDFSRGRLPKDTEGNTALHLAAVEDEASMISILLDGAEDLAATNDAGDTALHLAVRSGSAVAVQMLLKSGRVNVDIKGWNGETPLHVAASLNQLECAKILVASSATINIPCTTGERPIHRASGCGATDVLSYLLDIRSDSVDVLLNATDDEEATPLHLGVNSGDIDTVKILLEHGAPIGAQMFDLSTPLHLACAQGLSEMVELIHAFNVVDFDRVVRMKDAQGMTPMHRAAMFNFWDILRLLIDKHASIDSQDDNGRTVLTLAASCGSWDSVTEMLCSNADPLICSNDGQNFIHAMVSIGGDPALFRNELNKNHMLILMNGKDNNGQTPLHYAAKNGFGKCCETLLEMGSSLTEKDGQFRSALHLAASNGRYDTAKRILNTAVGLGLLNDVDVLGRPALHLAAENGHTKLVSLFLSKGAMILRDAEGRTPLHLASVNDQTEVAGSLIAAHPHLLDAADKTKNTALHIAASNNSANVVTALLIAGAKLTLNQESLTAFDLVTLGQNEEAAQALMESPRWKEILRQPSTLYVRPVYGLVEELPQVMMKVLDKCVLPSDKSSQAKDFFIKYDFEVLDHQSDTVQLGKTALIRHVSSQPLATLNHMIKFGRTELLNHTLCTHYLDTKWLSYGIYFHIISLSLYVIFVALLTYLALDGIEKDLRPHIRQANLRTIIKHKPEFSPNATNFGPVSLVLPEVDNTDEDSTLLALAIIFALLNLGKKMFQLFRQRATFFLRLGNWFELTLYFTTLVFAVAFYDEGDYYLSWKSQWLVGAVAIFLTWVNLFFYLQRYGEVGMQVVIFLRVTKTFIEAMCVFFVVVVAFSLTFTVLNPAKTLPDDHAFYTRSHDSDKPEELYYTAYSTLQTSILRVSDQMVGDADVIVNFISPILNGVMMFPVVTYAFAILSIGIITMLVQSLIVGLALGNVDEIRKTVKFRRKVMQVALHTEIEEKIPRRLMAYWVHSSITVYPNRIKSRFVKGLISYLTDGKLNHEVHEESQGRDRFNTLRENEISDRDQTIHDLFRKTDQQQELLRLIVKQTGRNMEMED